MRTSISATGHAACVHIREARTSAYQHGIVLAET
jgi:hypothetical protein